MSTIRHLSAEDVKNLMPSMQEVIDLVEEVLRQIGDGSARDDMNMAASTDEDTPSIQLNDAETGSSRAVMDASHITTARAGACTAITARQLADPNSEVLTIIGCGIQGKANLEALLAVFPGTERMLCYDSDVQRQEAFADEMMTTFDLASIIPPEPQEAVEGAQILVTATSDPSAPKPFIEPDWIQEGTLCVALDFDTAFTKEAFTAASRLVADDIGQYETCRAEGHFADGRVPDADLPSILSGKAPARGDDNPTVLAVHLGMEALDVALATHILDRAEREGCGTELPA
ncbi:MAG: hypothetical protein VX916_00260 [Planctomycetota bacterium]|nr:hypothetical protein [Planctomycetota bacterium]